MTPRYPVVLLDADNTLFDFDEAERRALRWLIAALGLSKEAKGRYLAINRALWHESDLGRIPVEELVVERFRRLFGEYGLQEDPAAWNRAYLQKLGECPALLPGAEEFCRALAEACTLAIVTNGVPSVQRSRMAASPLEPFFGDRLFISGELGSRKPERRFFDLTFAGLGLSEGDKPGVAVMGDNLLSDVKGALDYGLAAVWFSPGGGAAPGDVVPTFTAASYDRAAAFLLGDSIER